MPSASSSAPLSRLPSPPAPLSFLSRASLVHVTHPASQEHGEFLASPTRKRLNSVDVYISRKHRRTSESGQHEDDSPLLSPTQPTIGPQALSSLSHKYEYHQNLIMRRKSHMKVKLIADVALKAAIDRRNNSRELSQITTNNSRATEEGILSPPFLTRHTNPNNLQRMAHANKSDPTPPQGNATLDAPPPSLHIDSASQSEDAPTPTSMHLSPLSNDPITPKHIPRHHSYNAALSPMPLPLRLQRDASSKAHSTPTPTTTTNPSQKKTLLDFSDHFSERLLGGEYTLHCDHIPESRLKKTFLDPSIPQIIKTCIVLRNTSVNGHARSPTKHSKPFKKYRVVYYALRHQYVLEEVSGMVATREAKTKAVICEGKGTCMHKELVHLIAQELLKIMDAEERAKAAKRKEELLDTFSKEMNALHELSSLTLTSSAASGILHRPPSGTHHVEGIMEYFEPFRDALQPCDSHREGIVPRTHWDPSLSEFKGIQESKMFFGEGAPLHKRVSSPPAPEKTLAGVLLVRPRYKIRRSSDNLMRKLTRRPAALGHSGKLWNRVQSVRVIKKAQEQQHNALIHSLHKQERPMMHVNRLIGVHSEIPVDTDGMRHTTNGGFGPVRQDSLRIRRDTLKRLSTISVEDETEAFLNKPVDSQREVVRVNGLIATMSQMSSSSSLLMHKSASGTYPTRESDNVRSVPIMSGSAFLAQEIADGQPV